MTSASTIRWSTRGAGDTGERVKQYKYNIKELMAWICNSEAYNLSFESNATTTSRSTRSTSADAAERT